MTGGRRPRSRETAAGKPYHNIFEDPVVITGPRNSRNKRPMVEVDSDEDELMEEGPGDEEGAEEEEEEEEEEEGEGEGEGVEDDDDVHDDADDNASTNISHTRPRSADRRVPSKTVLKFTSQQSARAREAAASDDVKEEDDDDDDDDDNEQPSEPGSDMAEVSDVGAEDAQEEEEAEEVQQDDEEYDEEIEENEGESALPDSRMSTPDPARMTKRQRGPLGDDFLQLPMEPQIRKQLTAEEHAMRRTEMARRRKNLSQKRNQEEKMDTINKLLRKQAPKHRAKVAESGPDEEGVPAVSGEAQQPGPVQETEKPPATMLRYVFDSQHRCRLGVPEEWLVAPSGELFHHAKKPAAGPGPGGSAMGRMVEEIS